MSKGLLKKVPRRHYLHWEHSVNPNRATHPRVGHRVYLFPFQSNNLQSTHSKHSLFFLSLSLVRPHTLTGHQISGSSRRLLPLREARVLFLYPIARQDLRM